MNYKPFGTGVLLRRPKIKETTKSGVIKGQRTIASEDADWDQTYEVVEVGTDCKFAKVGMKVYARPGIDRIEIPKADETVYTYIQTEEYGLIGEIIQETINASLN